jgi:hypothetical protein
MKRFVQYALLPCLSLLMVGCGSSGNALVPSSISGKLTYKGKPIKGGILKFYNDQGTGYDANISQDGTFSATDIPMGELVVVVDTDSLKPSDTATKSKESSMRKNAAQQQPPPGVAAPPKLEDIFVQVPAKYKNPKTSTMTITIVKGRNVKDIDLTD